MIKIIFILLLSLGLIGVLTIDTSQEAYAQVTTSPNLNVNQGEGAGGATLDACSTVTISSTATPELEYITEWSIDGTVVTYAASLTIPADLSLTPPSHTIGYRIPNSVSSTSGTLFAHASAPIVFDFTFANPSSLTECPPSEVVFTTQPDLDVDQDMGGPILEYGSRITVSNPPIPTLSHEIRWVFNEGATNELRPNGGIGVTIPTDLEPGEHTLTYRIPFDLGIRYGSSGNGEVLFSNNEPKTFKFRTPPPDNEPNPVYTFDPLVFTNQENGGLVLEPGSTITVTGTTRSDLLDEITWTIDGAEQPNGATLTIPADIAPGEYEVGVVVIDMFALHAGMIFDPMTDPRTFKFTIAEPIPNPVYTFDPLITENQGPGGGGPTLESGDTLTITESTGSDLINQITWTINGVESVGPTVTIPAGLTPGVHQGRVVAPVITGNPITHTFEFTIAEPEPEPEPVYTFDPLITENQGAEGGGATLEPGDTITVTESTGSNLVNLITWSIDDVVQPVGPTLTIPAGLTPGPHRVMGDAPLIITTASDGAITFDHSTMLDFRFTIASSSSGGGNDWQKKPTFGKSYENTQFQVVEDGFVFNGNTLNIVDNWHTEFLKTSSIIGDTNNVKIKVYTDKLLSTATLQLGIPEIGKSSDAETGIHVILNRNYTSVHDYDIMEIIHEQDEPLINTDKTKVSIAPSHCTSDSVDMKCHTISFDFTIMAPLKYDVVAITATDNDRRSTITFINEGVEFLGDSLLESATHNIHQKLGNQAPSETITLTQQDRRYQVWEDNNGYLWTQNDFGTFTQITHPDFVRYDDASSNVMTRINSAFDAMILDEQTKAVLIFDSMTIQGTLDDSFAHVYPTTDKRDNMEQLLLDEEVRILFLLE